MYINDPGNTSHHFFPCYYSSGNRTPGSSLYSDLVHDRADSVCTHQLVLKPLSKAACIILPTSLQLVPINTHDNYAV